MNKHIQAITSVQFITWVIVFTIGFVAAVFALNALGAPTIVTFLAGIAFSEIADRAVDPFTDWYAEKTVDSTQTISE